jgi:anti-sigma B factor antagonist
MNITQEATDDTLTLRLHGELDASSAVGLDDALSDETITRFRRVLIDCTHLDYISSAGIGVFVANLQRFQDANSNLILFGMQDKVYNVFEILGLDALMTIVDTQEQALAHVGPHA